LEWNRFEGDQRCCNGTPLILCKVLPPVIGCEDEEG
jgi:hypothetical protein